MRGGRRIDEPLVAAMVREIAAIEEPMALMLRPDTVLELVGILQLAMRHPMFTGASRRTAERFVSGAREYFAGCPSVLEAIRRGGDPAEDR